MKIFEASHHYAYDWSQVTLAHWQKYPNPLTRHVVHVDVLKREVDPVTGLLRTERLITCQQKIPALIRKIIGGEDLTYAYEISFADSKAQTLTSHSVNLTYSNLMRVEETCTYRQDGMDASQTLFYQEAKITAFGALQKFAEYVEDISLKRFGENAAMGKRGFEQVLDRLIREGQDLAAKISI